MPCAALLISIAICLATIVDMYFTARYFHGRLEVFGAMVLGLDPVPDADGFLADVRPAT